MTKHPTLTASQALLLATVTATSIACQGTEGPILSALTASPAAAGASGSAGATGTAAAAGSGSVSPPTPTLTWQIQLAGTVDTTVDAELYIIDLDDPARVFEELATADRTVICFFSAGSLEPWREDAERFPPSTVGEPLAEYPDERWLDIRDPDVATIMSERIDAAAARGCDGVLPANADGFLSTTGFPLTFDDQLEFDRSLASAAQQAGLSIGLGGGNGPLAEGLAATYDWAFAVGCVASACTHLASFVALDKPVLVVEYGDATQADVICPRAAELGVNAIIKRPEFDAMRITCP